MIFLILFALMRSAVASHNGPMDCYTKARNNTVLTRDEILRLCQCAPSEGPANCYIHAKNNTTLTPGEIMQLCAPAERIYLNSCVDENDLDPYHY